jgi:hypothetical protein
VNEVIGTNLTLHRGERHIKISVMFSKSLHTSKKTQLIQFIQTTAVYSEIEVKPKNSLCW